MLASCKVAFFNPGVFSPNLVFSKHLPLVQSTKYYILRIAESSEDVLLKLG